MIDLDFWMRLARRTFIYGLFTSAGFLWGASRSGALLARSEARLAALDAAQCRAERVSMELMLDEIGLFVRKHFGSEHNAD